MYLHPIGGSHDSIASSHDTLLPSIHPSMSFLSFLVAISAWKPDFSPFPACAVFSSSFQEPAWMIMPPCSLHEGKADERKNGD